MTGLFEAGIVMEPKKAQSRVVFNECLTQERVDEVLSCEDWGGTVFYECSFDRLDLSNRLLWGPGSLQASYIDCEFDRVDFSKATFSCCNLNGCRFTECNLEGARFDGACLAGAQVCESDFTKAIGLPILPDAPQRLYQVALHILADTSQLDMTTWSGSHSGCGTAMCIQGHAVNHAGSLARVLTTTLGHEVAGMLLLGPEAAMHFYDDDDPAIEFLQSVVDRGQPPAITRPTFT